MKITFVFSKNKCRVVAHMYVASFKNFYLKGRVIKKEEETECERERELERASQPMVHFPEATVVHAAVN